MIPYGHFFDAVIFFNCSSMNLCTVGHVCTQVTQKCLIKNMYGVRIYRFTVLSIHQVGEFIDITLMMLIITYQKQCISPHLKNDPQVKSWRLPQTIRANTHDI